MPPAAAPAAAPTASPTGPPTAPPTMAPPTAPPAGPPCAMAMVDIESAETTSAPVISVRFTSHLLLLGKKAELAARGIVPGGSVFCAASDIRNKSRAAAIVQNRT